MLDSGAGMKSEEGAVIVICQADAMLVILAEEYANYLHGMEKMTPGGLNRRMFSHDKCKPTCIWVRKIKYVHIRLGNLA